MLVVQHDDDDPPGLLGDRLAAAGRDVRTVRGHRGEELPGSLRGLAGLVVLGGPMGAYDDAHHPWLSTTKLLLAEAVQRDLPTLAVCLGHQLLAVATGGRVARAAEPQRGLLTVQCLVHPDDDLLGDLRPGAQALHWNDDLVVDAPAAATVLARSGGGVQALRLGRHVRGVQFHPEVSPDTVAGWARSDVASGVLTEAAATGHLADLRRAAEEQLGLWSSFADRFATEVGRDSD